jgi:hypothetical protein
MEPNLELRSDSTPTNADLVGSRGQSHSGPACFERRGEFLLEMYRQTSVHLGRHVSGVWQCVGVVGGALAVFALDKDKPLNDYACALVVMLCGWLIATTMDASNWFNRNITIISNIERLFLQADDAKVVHPFFLGHRRAGKHAEHFRIQIWLGVAVAALVLMYHFGARVWDGLSSPMSSFQPSRALPYALALVVGAACVVLLRNYKRKDEELQAKSPGLKTGN